MLGADSDSNEVGRNSSEPGPATNQLQHPWKRDRLPRIGQHAAHDAGLDEDLGPLNQAGGELTSLLHRLEVTAGQSASSERALPECFLPRRHPESQD